MQTSLQPAPYAQRRYLGVRMQQESKEAVVKLKRKLVLTQACGRQKVMRLKTEAKEHVDGNLSTKTDVNVHRMFTVSCVFYNLYGLLPSLGPSQFSGIEGRCQVAT